MGRKLGAAVPLFSWEGGWVPVLHNVARPEAYITIASGILIHPNLWAEYTNVTDRQIDRQDRQTTVH